VRVPARTCEGHLSPARQIARLGTPRRLLPISRELGMDRGEPIDRYYIDDFL
jgi:hypothetical protein